MNLEFVPPRPSGNRRQRFADEIAVMIFHPVGDKLVGHPDGEGVVRCVEKPGRLQPCVEALFVDVSLEVLQTWIPDFFV